MIPKQQPFLLSASPFPSPPLFTGLQLENVYRLGSIESSPCVTYVEDLCVRFSCFPVVGCMDWSGSQKCFSSSVFLMAKD